MKAGKTLTELATELERQKETKRDFIAPVNKVAMFDDATLEIGDVERMPITPLAHDQIGDYTGIPAKYYDRMLEANPGLLADNVNYWLGKQNGEQRMVRTLDGKVRAFLSNKYRRLDNFDLAEVALPALIEAGAKVESCDVTEKRLYIKAVAPEIKYEVRPGDIIESGVIISNSEVGAGALAIEPLLHRLVCLNGLIVNEAKHRRMHIGRGNEQFSAVTEFFTDETRKADDKAYWMKVRDFMQGMFSNFGFKSFVEKFGKSIDDHISGNPEKVVEVAQQRLGLLESERSSVLMYLMQGGDLNKFGLINAITATAQDVPSYDRSVELERLGGYVLELPKTDWEVIATAE